MTITITCQCGERKVISDYAHRHGQRYCSQACAKRFRVYATKAETLADRVTVPLTKGQRETLERRAELEGVSLAVLARRYVVEGLEG